MGNIADYLVWRGNLFLADDPFNEVDNLVLSQLSYVDFDGIVSDAEDEFITIGEVYERYWQMHTPEEIEARISFVKKAPFLLEKVANHDRFGDMKLAGYVNNVSDTREAQMSAVQFWLSDGTVFVAFRGTDETLVGWKEDFNLCYMEETEGQRLAADYLQRYFGKTKLRLRVGGHSKGGNFAIFASAFSGKEVRDQIEKVYTNDGPGFRARITGSEEYQEIISRTVSIVPEDSIIGMLLESGLDNLVVKSSKMGIMQHDAMSWQVLGNHFIEGKRSRDSIFLDKTLDTWLDGIDDDRRKMFVDLLFAFLQSTGARTMKEVKSSSVKETAAIIHMARELPREQQKDFVDILLELVESGGRTLSESIKGAWASREARLREKIEEKQEKREELHARIKKKQEELVGQHSLIERKQEEPGGQHARIEDAAPEPTQ